MLVGSILVRSTYMSIISAYMSRGDMGNNMGVIIVLVLETKHNTSLLQGSSPLFFVVVNKRDKARSVQEDPMNTSRPFNEKFQNGPFLRKMPYYSPWFFIVLKRYFRRAKKGFPIDHGFGEMFKRAE